LHEFRQISKHNVDCRSHSPHCTRQWLRRGPDGLWHAKPDLILSTFRQSLDTLTSYNPRRAILIGCFRRIDSIGCEESIRKEGFTFSHRCPTQKIIFESLLEKHGIKFRSGESDRFHQRGEFMAFLPDLGVFASDSVHGLSETVEALSLDSLLAFSKKPR